MKADDDALKQLRILAVDDEESNVRLLRLLLEHDGYVHVVTETDPARVPAIFVETNPDLVLLDLHMPGMDGFGMMEMLGARTPTGRSVPYLVLTADANEETKRRALSAGARDFLTKPFDQSELLLRVRNLLQVQQLEAELRRRNETLETEVAERTEDLELARIEILDRLALAAEYRDDATQQHAWRIGRTCALLASGLGLPGAEVELFRRAAPLHDIGKIGIPDAILLKPGRLTWDEFEHVKMHAIIGAQILSGSRSPLLTLAEEIALSHHERWDGRGYPRALRGEEIPWAGRIVAVADVFDALTHERPYKEAWPVQRALEEILGESGRQFDSDVVEVFSTLQHETLLTRVEKHVPSVEPPASAV